MKYVKLHEEVCKTGSYACKWTGFGQWLYTEIHNNFCVAQLQGVSIQSQASVWLSGVFVKQDNSPSSLLLIYS